jgi:hypothetical protein
MKTSDILLVGGAILIGYMLYKGLSKTKDDLSAVGEWVGGLTTTTGTTAGVDEFNRTNWLTGEVTGTNKEDTRYAGTDMFKGEKSPFTDPRNITSKGVWVGDTYYGNPYFQGGSPAQIGDKGEKVTTPSGVTYTIGKEVVIGKFNPIASATYNSSGTKIGSNNYTSISSNGGSVIRTSSGSVISSKPMTYVGSKYVNSTPNRYALISSSPPKK